jgi:undecaprenyl diphosphate synthase
MSRRQSTSVPTHVGIVMDGNGRWALARGLPRTEGHQEGLKATKRIVREARVLGVQYLTLYAFSTENWKRSVREVSFLMHLIGNNLTRETEFYRENDVRILHSGDRHGLPGVVLREIDAVVAATARHRGLTVNLAINYGGRDEIVRAVNRWLAEGGSGRRSRTLTPAAVSRNLDQPALPEADLIIRTGREKRLSNFLLWQCPYAELYFSHKLWPDFAAADLRHALEDYAGRERRFGRAR